MNVRLLRLITKTFLTDFLHSDGFDLAVYLVQKQAMAQLNEKFLQHEGSTDVITFNYADSPGRLHGELFICIDDAIEQARRFRTTWPSEIVRYVIHGILHLQGYDDLHAVARRKMKREENRLLGRLSRLFPLRKLASDSKLPA